MVNSHTSFTIQNHFPEGYENYKILYDVFQSNLIELDSRIQANPNKKYIGFIVGSKVVIAVSILQSKIHLYRLEPDNLIYLNNKVKYKAKSFQGFNKHFSYTKVNRSDDINYAFNLTKQVINKYFNISNGRIWYK